MFLTPFFSRLVPALGLALAVVAQPAAAAAPAPTLLNARSLALGGAVRALSDPVESARVNPAGLSVQRGFFAGSSYATRHRSAYDAFSLTLVDNITSPMGGALQYQSTQGPGEEREEIGLGLALGKPGLRWGFTTRYVHGRVGATSPWRNEFTGDVGMLFERPGGIRLAVVGYDLPGTALAFLERRVAIGVAQTGVGPWSLESDLVRNLDRDFASGLDLQLGAEYRDRGSPWMLRMGYQWRGDTGKDYPSLGAGYAAGHIRWGYGMQLARQDHGELLHLLSMDGSF